MLYTEGGANPDRELAATLQHDQATQLDRLSPADPPSHLVSPYWSARTLSYGQPISATTTAGALTYPADLPNGAGQLFDHQLWFRFVGSLHRFHAGEAS